MSFFVRQAPFSGDLSVSGYSVTGESNRRGDSRWQIASAQRNSDLHVALGLGPTKNIDVAVDGYLSNAAQLQREWGLPELEADPAKLIGELYAQLGLDTLKLLYGSYALCIVDNAGGPLLAARDRVGGRTMYWFHDGSRYWLSTRAGAIARVSGGRLTPNPSYFAKSFTLRQAPPAGSTGFLGITELLPGEVLMIDDTGSNGFRLHARLLGNQQRRSDADYIDAFRNSVESAVLATLPTEGRVACMLSGGLDSGPMAAFASRLLAPAQNRLKLISWSLRDYPKADEASWILRIQERLRIPLSIVDGSTLLPFSMLDETQLSPELPAYNPFRPLLNLMYKNAADEGCSVVLNGFAGDELYPPPRLVYADALSKGDYAFVASDVYQTARKQGLRGLRQHSPLRYLLRRKGKDAALRPAPAWMTSEAASLVVERDTDEPLSMAHHFPAYAQQLLGPAMAFGRAHEQDFPNRFGVVRRDPFHDENLIAFMLALPFSLSFRAGQSKWIMREAMRGLLPSAVRRKVRTGRLNTFYSAGLKHNQERVTEFLFDQQPVWADYIRPDSLRQALKDDNSVPVVLVSSCIGAVLWANHWKLSRLM